MRWDEYFRKRSIDDIVKPVLNDAVYQIAVRRAGMAADFPVGLVILPFQMLVFVKMAFFADNFRADVAAQGGFAVFGLLVVETAQYNAQAVAAHIRPAGYRKAVFAVCRINPQIRTQQIRLPQSAAVFVAVYPAVGIRSAAPEAERRNVPSVYHNTAVAVAVDHGIALHLAAAENVGIVPFAACQPVCSGTAVQRIVAAPAFQNVVAAAQIIGAVVAKQPVFQPASFPTAFCRKSEISRNS